MFSTLTKEETSLMMQGPAGEIEAIVAEVTPAEPSAWAIVCHPHPLYGGTMHNKVVTTLVKTFQELGANTVRFNFRGVGKSGGEFAHGIGELEDLLAVVDWVLAANPKREIWLGGFSFGAYIAASMATQIPVRKLVTIAPPVENFPMENIPPITCPWVVVQGEQDEVVSAEKVLAWAEARDPQPRIIRFPDASHFFHGQLMELRERIKAALT